MQVFGPKPNMATFEGYGVCMSLTGKRPQDQTNKKKLEFQEKAPTSEIVLGENFLRNRMRGRRTICFETVSHLRTYVGHSLRSGRNFMKSVGCAE